MASRLVLSSTRRVRIQPRNIFTPLLNPKHHSRPSAGGSSCSLQVSTFSRSLPFLSQNKDSKANAHESLGTRAGNTEKDADDESPSSAVKNKRLDPYADESSTTSEPGAGDKDNSHASDPSPTGTGNSGDADPRGSTVEDGAGSSNDNSTSNKDSGIGAGRGPLTWGAVALLGITGALLLGYYQMEREKRETQVASDVKTTGKPALGGPFTLVDMHGRPVTDKDFHGYFAMLYFGFCHCPDICPSELVKVGAIAKKLQDKLGEGVVKPVFISVDPDRDSLAQLRHYAQDFHKSIEYLTGTKDQVAKAAKAYRVYFSKTEEHEEGEDYLVDHSIVIYLLAPDGDFLDFFTQRTTIADCVEKTLKHVTDFRASSKDKR